MNDAAELCLTVDLGTGGPKIGLVTLDGDVLDHELHCVETTFTENGGAEQDADEWWTLISDSAKRLLARPDVSASRVKAVAVTGQYASTVPVDANGVATGPCLLWLDTRGGAYVRQAIGGPMQGYNARKVMQFIRKTGGAPSTTGADPIGQALFLMNERPDVMAATKWLMEPVDYLTMRFTGVASASHASRLAMWVTDNRELNNYSYDQDLLDIVGISGDLLPPLLPIGSVVGSVAQSVAEELGLSPDTPVITGMPDLHAAAVGSGGTEMYATHVALSTTSWISCPVPKKKTDIAHSIASIPGLTNDSYLIINNQETGAKSLEWFQGVLAGNATTMSFNEMTALAATSPTGANGVTFTPWLAGERCPSESKTVRAGFANLSVTSNTADLIRAVMEGVATNSAWLFKYVEKFADTRLTPLRLVGGGALSTLWCQIYADTLDREIEQVREPMVAQLRGAALMAGVTLQRHRLSDVAALAPRGERFQPSAAAHDLYRQRIENLPDVFQREKKRTRRRQSKKTRT